MRVPYDACLPKQGAWDCYKVTDAKETIDTIAAGGYSMVRNATLWRSINTDIMWGDEALYPGMQLRSPVT